LISYAKDMAECAKLPFATLDTQSWTMFWIDLKGSTVHIHTCATNQNKQKSSQKKFPHPQQFLNSFKKIKHKNKQKTSQNKNKNNDHQ